MFRRLFSLLQATRRVLGVLLRQLDGFDDKKRSVVIAATNRKADLDPALLSRFDASVCFDLPDAASRSAILAQYAKHLTSTQLDELAACTEGFSGRDLRDVCEQAERKWASMVREQRIKKLRVNIVKLKLN
jgi:ATP-dependent 26S proteasome regulatory subunit